MLEYLPGELETYLVLPTAVTAFLGPLGLPGKVVEPFVDTVCFLDEVAVEIDPLLFADSNLLYIYLERLETLPPPFEIVVDWLFGVVVLLIKLEFLEVDWLTMPGVLLLLFYLLPLVVRTGSDFSCIPPFLSEASSLS